MLSSLVQSNRSVRKICCTCSFQTHGLGRTSNDSGGDNVSLSLHGHESRCGGLESLAFRDFFRLLLRGGVTVQTGIGEDQVLFHRRCTVRVFYPFHFQSTPHLECSVYYRCKEHAAVFVSWMNCLLRRCPAVFSPCDFCCCILFCKPIPILGKVARESHVADTSGITPEEYTTPFYSSWNSTLLIEGSSAMGTFLLPVHVLRS